MKKTELLIPVGNKECLLAAIHNGADAVYLGGKKFGARAYANNFNDEDMIEAINLCHKYNVKIYVTVNTMIYNEEIKEIIKYLSFLYENNVDAVIVQDLGIINLIRKNLPKLDVHVSTQAHNHNEIQTNYYSKIGCKRVVFDREMSLNEINQIKTPIEKEIFVYGALCICYSGNCLFSALNGGRSANRGMCVGSCRLPYKLIQNNKETKKGYLLSTKDLNTIENLKEILDSNIDSLKIEGRMKSKEYVALITKIYRRLIDAYYQNKEISITEKEKEDILKTYNREFTKGYLLQEKNIINSKTSNHQGIKIGQIINVIKQKIYIKLEKSLHQEDAIRIANTNEGMFINKLYNQKGLLIKEAKPNEIIYIENKSKHSKKEIIGSPILKTIDYLLNQELNNNTEKKIPIEIKFNAFLNNNISIEIKENEKKILIEGPKVEKAISTPITKEKIIQQLSKLGNTPFILKNITIGCDKNIFINIKDLNILRRTAIEQLINSKINIKNKISSDIKLKNIPNTNELHPKISILVRNEKQLNIALNNNINYIYVEDENLYNKYKNRGNLYLKLDRVISNFKEYKNESLLCTELGSIIKYCNQNKIRTDYNLNIANDYSIDELYNLGSESITISVESSIEQLKNIKNKAISEVIIYGTPECMIIKNNIFNLPENNIESYLEDINKHKYYIKYTSNKTHIYNHQPINIIKQIKNISGFGTYRIELFKEDETITQRIINEVKDML